MFTGDLQTADLVAYVGAATVPAERGTTPAALAHVGAEPKLKLTAVGAPVEASDIDTAADAVASPILKLARSRSSWMLRYQLVVGISDLVMAALACVLGVSVRFGSLGSSASLAPSGTLFALCLPVLWVAALAANRAYESRFVGAGTTEFRRMSRAFLHLIALTTFLSYITRVYVSREVMLIALPLIPVLSAVARLLTRKLLRRWRAAGKAVNSVLVVGAPDAIGRFTDRLTSHPLAGSRVVGACVPQDLVSSKSATMLSESGVALFGGIDRVREWVRVSGASTVIVLSGTMDAEALRRVSWELEDTDIDLILSSGLTDVADRRLHILPIGGVAVVYVDGARFKGVKRVVKGLFDRAVAALALLFLVPVLLTVAAFVGLGSKGPVFFRQTRVGKDGKLFRMIKFRTMCVDAEQRRVELVSVDEGAGLLFKMRHDPRVTRVGRVLRRYSLDELPQLLNVVLGSMSLVGPRPPLPAEVELYGDDVRRRLLVKPGLTGVWQVSGRSNLSWEESVHLDLRYVENWSLTLDLAILLKTVRAVLRAEGAY
jgi:exopolysaccharide biosynthesis polyprenyl glycosylphosphotransferase